MHWWSHPLILVGEGYAGMEGLWATGGQKGAGNYVTFIECRVWGRLVEAQGEESKESLLLGLIGREQGGKQERVTLL